MSKAILFSIIIGFCNLACAESHTPFSAPELSTQFKTAHEARNYDLITSLINWDGVRKPMKKKIEVYTTATFGLPINSISIEEVPADQFQKVNFGSKTFKPNMTVSHLMKVHFDIDKSVPEATDKDTAVYLLGKKDDHYMIAVYVKEGGSARQHD